MVAFQNVRVLDPENDVARHMIDAYLDQTTERAPDQYVRNLFDDYASRFEKDLTKNLDYKIPKLSRELFDKNLTEGRLELNLPVKSALDLGCGTGLVAQAFKGAVSEFDGVDLS